MGRHLSPRYSHVILDSGYPVLTVSIDRKMGAISGCRLPHQLKGVRFLIGFPVVWIDSPADGWSHDYLNFSDVQITQFSWLWGSTHVRLTHAWSSTVKNNSRTLMSEHYPRIKLIWGSFTLFKNKKGEDRGQYTAMLLKWIGQFKDLL